MPSLLRTSYIGFVADDHQAGCYPNARLQWRAASQCSDCQNQFKRRSNRALGVVFVRLRIAKINYGSVAISLGHETVVPVYCLSDASVITFGSLA